MVYLPNNLEIVKLTEIQEEISRLSKRIETLNEELRGNLRGVMSSKNRSAVLRASLDLSYLLAKYRKNPKGV